jgi:anaerobic ribonucleoside-triphosphate reductase activating protein
MRIGLNKLHFPVTSLGPGRRVGIWLQGCSVGCPGCISRDTWSTHDDYFVEVSDLVKWCRGESKESIDGVTISGGEPFEQPDGLAALLDGLSTWRTESQPAMDFLCYSGLPIARLRRDFSPILGRLDAIISEPYVARLPSNRIWRGSANQSLVPLSDLGQQRYAPFVDAAPTKKGSFQVMTQEGRIWFIGIPARGDFEKLELACRDRGVVAEGMSWRA